MNLKSVNECPATERDFSLDEILSARSAGKLDGIAFYAEGNCAELSEDLAIMRGGSWVVVLFFGFSTSN